ncbi:MAG: alpha/beta hydrolase [Candidatus Marinimicrobia bacterium]|nr:alpha/beta hydrolase [Candidatus Neomarinimicrobiota bacterium]
MMMIDKKYPGLNEEFNCGGYQIKVKHSVTGRKPFVRILLGPGLFTASEDVVLANMAHLAVAENIDIVRFDYPEELKATTMHPHLSERRKIYRCIFKHIIAESDEEVPLFIGGKSLSALVASEISDKAIAGYVFISLPLRLPYIPIPLPQPGINKNHKPMLFIYGKQDELAPFKSVEKKIKKLNPHAYLLLLPEAGHSLQPVMEDGRSQEEINEEISNVLFWYISDVLHKRKLN